MKFWHFTVAMILPILTDRKKRSFWCYQFFSIVTKTTQLIDLGLTFTNQFVAGLVKKIVSYFEKKCPNAGVILTLH
jgi:hypothetical protein